MFIGISTAPTHHIPALEVSDTGVSVENQGQRDPVRVCTVHILFFYPRQEQVLLSKSYFRLYLNHFKETVFVKLRI